MEVCSALQKCGDGQWAMEVGPRGDASHVPLARPSQRVGVCVECCRPFRFAAAPSMRTVKGAVRIGGGGEGGATVRREEE